MLRRRSSCLIARNIRAERLPYGGIGMVPCLMHPKSQMWWQSRSLRTVRRLTTSVGHSMIGGKCRDVCLLLVIFTICPHSIMVVFWETNSIFPLLLRLFPYICFIISFSSDKYEIQTEGRNLPHLYRLLVVNKYACGKSMGSEITTTVCNSNDPGLKYDFTARNTEDQRPEACIALRACCSEVRHVSAPTVTEVGNVQLGCIYPLPYGNCPSRQKLNRQCSRIDFPPAPTPLRQDIPPFLSLALR